MLGTDGGNNSRLLRTRSGGIERGSLGVIKRWPGEERSITCLSEQKEKGRAGGCRGSLCGAIKKDKRF